jgi:hypothetical protein
MIASKVLQAGATRACCRYVLVMKVARAFKRRIASHSSRNALSQCSNRRDKVLGATRMSLDNKGARYWERRPPGFVFSPGYFDAQVSRERRTDSGSGGHHVS